MRKTVLLIRHKGCPISDASHEVPSVRLYNLSQMTVEEEAKELKSLLKVVGSEGDISSWIEELHSHPLDIDIDLLSSIPSEMGATYVYIKPEYSADLPSIAHTLSKHECFLPTQATVHRGLERWPLYVPDEQDVKVIIEDIRTFSPKVRVEKDIILEDISEESLTSKGEVPHFGLTFRQVEVLIKAFEMGYYDNTQDLTMEQIGDELDLTSATVCEHLNNAENKIISDVVQGSL